MSSTLTFLQFLSPSATGLDGNVVERVISRADLLEVAPDREDALMSHATTEELRETLKLRSTSHHA